MHYTMESVIASSKYTILEKQAVPCRPDRLVINVLFLVTVTFNHTDVLKLTGALVHTLLLTNTLLCWPALLISKLAILKTVQYLFITHLSALHNLKNTFQSKNIPTVM